MMVIAKMRFFTFLCPTGLHILWSAYVGIILKTLRYFPSFARFVLSTRISLLGYSNQTGIYYLTFPSFITLSIQLTHTT